MLWDVFAQWREAQISLDYHLQIHADGARRLEKAAIAVAGKIKALEPNLDVLCARTCIGCEDKCCLRATVRYDFRDLLFLHLVGKGLPVGQSAPLAGKACSCLGKNGCTIDRLMRPFMCTWYLCPGQMELVRSEEKWREYNLQERLREIQNDRKELESGFLKLVSPYEC